MKKPKKNKWYTFDGPIKPKPNTGGIIGITDMGCLFELFILKKVNGKKCGQMKQVNVDGKVFIKLILIKMDIISIIHLLDGKL